MANKGKELIAAPTRILSSKPRAAIAVTPIVDKVWCIPVAIISGHDAAIIAVATGPAKLFNAVIATANPFPNTVPIGPKIHKPIGSMIKIVTNGNIIDLKLSGIILLSNFSTQDARKQSKSSE